MAIDYGELDVRLSELRPRLHRYCARMTGSVIDGEDVAQDAFVKASVRLRDGEDIANLESWLFKIAHNAAIDFLRKRSRREATMSDVDPDLFGDVDEASNNLDIVAMSLARFMRLPVVQRGTVILMDVLGYRLRDICDIMDVSLPAAKSALHRGRVRLRELASEPEDTQLPTFSDAQRALLGRYVDRFNARDFDAIRDMLAEEVRLDIVNRIRRSGKAQVASYFTNYANVSDWRLSLGLVDGCLAIIVHDPERDVADPTYFMLLEWRNDRVLGIRDFRYARYVMSDAHVLGLAP